MVAVAESIAPGGRTAVDVAIATNSSPERPIPRFLGKLISLDDLQQIVTDAGLEHQRDLYTTSLSKLLLKGGDPLTELSTAYELAESLGIPKERIDAIMAIRYPSPEEQLQALEAHGATATTRAVARSYQAELLTRLRAGLPSRTFDAVIERMDSVFDKPHMPVKWRRAFLVRIVLVNEREVSTRETPGWRNWFGLRRRDDTPAVKREEVTLATIGIGNELVATGHSGRFPTAATTQFHQSDRLCIAVTVSSGVFLKLCSGALDELRARFEKHNGIAMHDVVYDYVVD